MNVPNVRNVPNVPQSKGFVQKSRQLPRHTKVVEVGL